jgi:predicted nuclease of predicted toxin-antitoxin system
MRFLANENYPGDAVTALRQRGHDVAWVRTDAPGSMDPDVLKRAQLDERILLTFDKDFGELAFRAKLPAACGIVLFRIPTPSADYVARVTVAAIESRTDWAGHFAVVEEDQIRLTPLPEV